MNRNEEKVREDDPGAEEVVVVEEEDEDEGRKEEDEGEVTEERDLGSGRGSLSSMSSTCARSSARIRSTRSVPALSRFRLAT